MHIRFTRTEIGVQSCSHVRGAASREECRWRRHPLSHPSSATCMATQRHRGIWIIESLCSTRSVFLQRVGHLEQNVVRIIDIGIYSSSFQSMRVVYSSVLKVPWRPGERQENPRIGQGDASHALGAESKITWHKHDEGDAHHPRHHHHIRSPSGSSVKVIARGDC